APRDDHRKKNSDGTTGTSPRFLIQTESRIAHNKKRGTINGRVAGASTRSVADDPFPQLPAGPKRYRRAFLLLGLGVESEPPSKSTTTSLVLLLDRGALDPFHRLHVGCEPRDGGLVFSHHSI